MAGLLDFLNTDDARLGLGLLAAGGPSTVPMSVGQRVAGAMQGMDADKQNKLRLGLLQSQIEENASQRDVQKQKLLLAQRQQAIDEQFMGGGLLGPSPASTSAPAGLGAAPSAGVPGASGAAGQAPAQTPVGGGFTAAQISQRFGLPMEAVIADYRFNGGKKIAELIAERSKPNWMNVGGNLVNTNAAGFKGGIQDQVNISNDGRATVLRANGGDPVVGAPAGALATYGAYQGIANRSNADFTPQEVIGPDGRRVVMPRSAVLQPMAGQAGNVQSPGYSGGDRNAANAESIRIIQGEMLKPGNTPEDMAGLRREMARLQMQSGQPVTSAPAGNVVGLSPAEEAANKAAETRAVNTASADVVRDTATQKKEKSAGEMIAAVRRARELLKEGPTASGLGEMVDKGAAFFGKSNKGAEVSAKLDIVAGDLVNNVPRMEGPQSDGDRVEYKIQAGRAADRSIPTQQRIAAMDEVERLQLKYAKLNGGAPGAEGGWEPNKTESKTLQELPKTGAVGSRVRDTQTGKILRFDGMKWKEE